MIAERLKSLREEKNILQKDVAKYLNITTSAYGFYEQGKRTPDANVLSMLSDFYGVSTDYLLGRTNVRSPYNSQKESNSSDQILIEKTKDLSPEGLKELDELIDLLKYKDMMKKEKDDTGRNKAQ